jgi:hypothetical protein
MAAAFVSGVAALLFQAFPEATAGQVADAIIGSCTPLVDTKPLWQGKGLIDPERALKRLEELVKQTSL